MHTYDMIVVGLGTTGSATCRELARRGRSVLGLDAFRPPHDRGSHHGESRSIRRAYLEGTAYVPMAQRAWELWRKLERDARQVLLTPTGNLTIGPLDGSAMIGFLASARTYGIPHEALAAAEVRKRWPQLAMPDTFAAGLEVEAGIIFPEPAVATLLAEARGAGAALHVDERVASWSEHGGRVQVRTSRGKYEAGRLLLAAGAGTRKLLGELGAVFSPKRVPVHWVAPPAERDYSLGAFPVSFWQLPAAGAMKAAGGREFYALPVTRAGGRVKVAAHNHLADCDPETMDRKVAVEEAAGIRVFLEKHLPALASTSIRSDVCLYTLTPDGEFALGPLPGYANVFTAALAGHGFKFAPVLGEVLADMLEGRTPPFDVEKFSLRRFGPGLISPSGVSL